MSLFDNINTDENAQGEKDTVGGFGPLETGLYPVEVSMAYLEKKQSGAVFLNVALKTDDGREYKEGLCIASGDAKGNKNYYETQSGERKQLPGFSTADSLAMLTTGEGLMDVDRDVKTIGIYNYDAGKEVLTEVEVLTGLLGQRVIAGIQKQIVDKNAKGNDGVYRPTGEIRETNEIDKLFCARDSHLHMTTAEIKAKADSAAFYDTWDKKNTGQTRNKVTAANDSNGGSAGAPAAKAAAGGGKPTTSLFG